MNVQIILEECSCLTKTKCSSFSSPITLSYWGDIKEYRKRSSDDVTVIKMGLFEYSVGNS